MFTVRRTAMREADGIDWTTALTSASIRALIEHGHLQLGLFDERNLVELASPDYPGERLVACRNSELARLRRHGRDEPVAATERRLDKIKARVRAGNLAGADAIGLRVGKVVNQYQVAKHFELAIGERAFTFQRKREGIAAEAALDGVYIIRTPVNATQMDAPECVRNYKALVTVERAVRSLKTIGLKVRPVHHRTGDRVCAADVRQRDDVPGCFCGEAQDPAPCTALVVWGSTLAGYGTLKLTCRPRLELQPPLWLECAL